MRAPDYADALIGWRVWRVVRHSGGLRLGSVLHDEVWEPRRSAAAACRERHVAPDPSCACGFYAALERRAALPYLVGREDRGTVGRVLGRVALWGTVVECDEGWRGQLAYPVLLLVAEARPDLAAGLREYGVPVELVQLARGGPSHVTSDAWRVAMS
jgi:hypothetical protein